MQNRVHSPANMSCVAARQSTENRTKAGSSDTEAKLLMVIPALVPSSARVVTTATPVAN